MKKIKLLLKIIIVSLMVNFLYGQETEQNITNTLKPVKLSGPRLGVTFLSDKFVNTIEKKHEIRLEPLIAQFGWQFENRFFTVKSGATAVSEWVILIGGFEQEKFLPSLTWLIGMRSGNGFEFGAGPNLAISGTSTVIATGITFQSEEINFPVNFAMALSKSGTRFSLLVGFNMRTSN